MVTPPPARHVPPTVTLVTATPAYYHVPLYRRLAKSPAMRFQAIFTQTFGIEPVDRGYGHAMVWDQDLLDGYDHAFLGEAHELAKRGSTAITWREAVRTVVEADVLWVHGYADRRTLALLWRRKLARKPIIIREEQTLLDRRPLVKRFPRWLLLRMTLQGCHGLAIGTENRRWLEQYGVRPDRIVLSPYAIDAERLLCEAAPLDATRRELRAALGIPDEAVVILTVARFIRKKGLDTLIESFARLGPAGQAWLMLVGSGEEDTALRRQVQELGAERVVFAGFVQQSRVAPFYAMADIFVLASRFAETWGLVVNEAMVFGLPVVATDRVGSATDLVRPYVNGFQVPPDDATALAHALGQLVGDAELRRRYGAASKEIISRWGYDEAEAGLHEAIRSAVDRRGRSA